jgi:hypothetical protein
MPSSVVAAIHKGVMLRVNAFITIANEDDFRVLPKVGVPFSWK